MAHSFTLMYKGPRPTQAEALTKSWINLSKTRGAQLCESSSRLHIAREDEKSLLNTMPSEILSKNDIMTNISRAQMRALLAETQNRNRIAL